MKNKPRDSTQRTQNVNNIVNHFTATESIFNEEETERDCCDSDLQNPNCSKREKVRMDKHDIEFHLKFKDQRYHPIVNADQFLSHIKKKT